MVGKDNMLKSTIVFVLSCGCEESEELLRMHNTIMCTHHEYRAFIVDRLEVIVNG